MSETMSIHRRESQSTIKELVMRFAPVSLVLAGLAALTASAGHSAAPEVLDPRALALQGQGRAALTAGDYDRATDGFEAALAISPGSASLVMDLAEVARREAMPGKALHYYRAVLERDPSIWRRWPGKGRRWPRRARSTRPSAIWRGCNRSVAMVARRHAHWPPRSTRRRPLPSPRLRPRLSPRS
jgi:tetratricopeptide (TPR) repeat protein